MPALSILAQRDSALAVNAPPPAERITFQHSEIFSEAQWASAQRYRESVDAFLASKRWQVVLVPGDGVPRLFYLTGSYASVRRRAGFIFNSLHTLSITPALSQSGGEVFDRRLHLSKSSTRRFT